MMQQYGHQNAVAINWKRVQMFKHFGRMLFQSGCQNVKFGWWGIKIFHTPTMILMLLLKVTMLTWKQHWELQSHDFMEDGWIGASISYWEMFCCIIGIRVWEKIGGLSQTRRKNELLLMLFFMQGTSQIVVWLF
jgi:hypothetical protein